jgi:NADPH2:quinone reductase
VTATSRTPERGARLAELGATVVEDVADAEGAFDVGMEWVGGAVTGAAALKLRRGGLLLWYGQGSGQPAELDFFAVMSGPADVAILSFVYWLEADRDPEDLATLVDLVAGGTLHPEIGQTADWSSTPRVLAAVRDRQVLGNAVLTVNGSAGNLGAPAGV